MTFDPHLANVSLLLHCDGADGSMNFIDSSPTQKNVALTYSANAVRISTEQSKFGGSCIYFSGAGITVPKDESTTFGAGDFTIEFWIRTASNRYSVLFDQQISESGVDAWRIGIDEGVMWWYCAGTIGEKYFSSTVSDGQWHHIAFARADGMLSLFVDGAFDAQWLVEANYAVASDIGIGIPISSYPQTWFIGYFDEVRITKGVARYTANFAPSTEPFPPDQPIPALEAYAVAPTPLGSVQALAMTAAYAFAANHSPLDSSAVVAAFDSAMHISLGQSTKFSAPSLVSVSRVQAGVQLLPFIPPLIAGYTATFGTVVAQQEQSIAAPVFGTPSVSFSTTHPATSIEATAAFGVPVAQSIHAAQSLEPVVFGAIGDPDYSAQASSLSGQTAFGQPVSATVHPVPDWYAGIRMGPLASSSFGSFPVLDGIQLTEFGEPRLGATAHGAMSLHLMPQFGPITISRGTMQC